MEHMIQVKDVAFEYENSMRSALCDIDLTVEQGEMLAIVGHNGSGKSTLAKHLNGLLLPTRGEVLVNGMKTSDPDQILNIRQSVGMVFQNPDNQIVTTIVEEDVAFGPENLGVPSAEIRARVDQCLEEVGMGAFKDRAPHMLSGGQKQRIAIAGMLAMEPKVLVLDEATAMLDPRGRQEVLSTVCRLNRKQGMTVVMITQYMEEAVLCDRVAVMTQGRIAMLATPREVFREEEALHSYGLDVPVMVHLGNQLKQSGISLANNPITVEEMAEALCQLLLKT